MPKKKTNIIQKPYRMTTQVIEQTSTLTLTRTVLLVCIFVISTALIISTGLVLTHPMLFPPSEGLRAITRTNRESKALPYNFPAIPDIYKEGGYIYEKKNASWTMRVVAGITTAGIHLSSQKQDDIKSFGVSYREKNGDILQAHPFTGSLATTNTIGNKTYYDLYITSLFHLKPDTEYTVSVNLYDIDSSTSGKPKDSLEITFRTQPDEFVFQKEGNSVVVNDGNITTLQNAINNATPGTEIMVEGTYKGSITFKKSGSKRKWIRVIGNNAILDGSYSSPPDDLSKEWEKGCGSLGCAGNVWTHDISSDYWGIWVKEMGELGFSYLYRFVKSDESNSAETNFKNSTSGQKAEKFCNPSENKDKTFNPHIWRGYHIEGKTLYLRLEDGKKPTDYDFIISEKNVGFDINNQNWIWVEGFDIKFFGNKNTGSAGVFIKNGNYNIVRNNKIYQTKNGVRIEWDNSDNDDYNVIDVADDGGAFNRIEKNEITANIRDKDNYYCKTKKGAAFIGIGMAGTVGNVLRENTLHNTGENGIQLQMSSKTASRTHCGRTFPVAANNNGEANKDAGCLLPYSFIISDTDVYKNTVYKNVEAVEPDGGQVMNARIFDNIFQNIEISLFSLQPGEFGPVWFIRNIINQPKNSPYGNVALEVFKFRGYPLTKYAYIYHNDIYIDKSAPGQRAYGVSNSYKNWRKVFRNNIFYNASTIIAEFPRPKDQNYSGKPDMDSDSFSGGKKLNWEEADYSDFAEFRKDSGLESLGNFRPHGFVDPESGDFSLSSGSANIDSGIIIAGINDNFCGKAPDIGAIEKCDGEIKPPPPPEKPPEKAICGNNICEGNLGETCSSCSQDCGKCSEAKVEIPEKESPKHLFDNAPVVLGCTIEGKSYKNNETNPSNPQCQICNSSNPNNWTNIAQSCNDNNPCTSNDTCSNGTCVGAKNIKEISCTDGVDNNCDGEIDGSDISCFQKPIAKIQAPLLTEKGKIMFVFQGQKLMLDGTPSINPNDGELTYSWELESNIGGEVKNKNNAQTFFQAPQKNGVVKILLTVTSDLDATKTSAPDTMWIIVGESCEK